MTAPRRFTSPNSVRERAIKASGTTTREPPERFDAKFSKSRPISHFVLLFNQLLSNLGWGKPQQEQNTRNLLEAKLPGSNLQEAEASRVPTPYRETFIAIYNTVNNLSVNQFNLSLAEDIYKELSLVIDGLSPTFRETDSENASILDQLVVVQTLLEIILVLFEDVQGMDELNRFVQRSQVFLIFQKKLQSLIRHLSAEGSQYSVAAVPELYKFLTPSIAYLRNEGSIFRSRLAGDRTTKPPPPPPPPEKSPAKEQEKGKPDKKPRPSH